MDVGEKIPRSNAIAQVVLIWGIVRQRERFSIAAETQQGTRRLSKIRRLHGFLVNVQSTPQDAGDHNVDVLRMKILCMCYVAAAKTKCAIGNRTRSQKLNKFASSHSAHRESMLTGGCRRGTYQTRRAKRAGPWSTRYADVSRPPHAI